MRLYRNLRSHLIGTAASVLLWGGGHASAQQPDPTPKPAAQSDSMDVVVTAQRRSEKLRDVPLSITAVTGVQLQEAGITNTLALTTTTPGLKMDRIGSNTLPAIRGVTTQLTAPGSDSNIAIYLDGVYQPSLGSNTFDLPDVDRIEVLKGPQGTLFGRNATGGAIQVLTRTPSYDPTGALTASYGNFDDRLITGFLSGPLIKDKVAGSLAGSYHKGDGYTHDLRTGGTLGAQDASLIRGKLRIDPTEDLTIGLTAFYVHHYDAANAYMSVLNGNSVGRLDPQAIIPTRPYDAATNSDLYVIAKSFGYSGTVEYGTPIGKLKSITAYNDYHVHGTTDGDATYQPNGGDILYDQTSDERSFTEEMTFASSLSGPLNFVVGGFFVNGNAAIDPLNLHLPTGVTQIYGYQSINAKAVFGELYFNLTDKISLIGGLRYSTERRSLSTGATRLGLPKPSLNYMGDKTWDSLTPRASIKYALTKRSNLYFTYSEGFKSGVYYTTALTPNPNGTQPFVNPEKIRSFEGGFKGNLTDSLSLNAAIYHYDYTDVQANAFTVVGGLPLSILQNAASAKINGIDLEATLRLSENFDIRAGLSILDAKYDDFPAAAIVTPRTNALGQITNTGNISTSFDASGKQMIRAPKYTLSTTANYTRDTDIGEFRLTGTLYYSDRIYYTFDNRISQPAYVTLDARASWSPLKSDWTIALYGRNLTDQEILSGTFITTLADAVTWAPPRTYGVEIGYRF
jgi:iron complex outermembrane recepter protein